MLTKEEGCYKLSLILSKSVKGGIETVKNDSGGQKVIVFTIKKNILCSGKPILRFVTAPFVSTFVILSSLTALLALLTAQSS